MTAPDTPSEEEWLALAEKMKNYERTNYLVSPQEGKLIMDALRLAAKPADDDVREATIEECAKVADTAANGAATTNGKWCSEFIARHIRALSTKAKP